MDELSGPDVLELGHGPGHLQADLVQNGIKTTGIDLSPQMCRIATRRLGRKGFDPRLVRAQAQRLPFEDCSYNEVVATFPSEYIFDSKTILETYRVLVPGGRFVILPVALIAGESLLERLAATLFRITNQSIPPDTSVLSRIEHYGFILQSKWIKKAGWEAFIITAQKPDSIS
jgi:ubiquinone/menaquinone biosynthesis C-methylase UbiE